MNNRTRIAVVVIIISSILLVTYIVGNKTVEFPEESLPIDTMSVPTPAIQETISQPELSSIVCQKPDDGMFYGGIVGSENNPPTGTSIDERLTKYYNMPTATGVCGTYWHLVGWWFNQSEMMKLPPECIMYKISPYAMTSGGGEMPIAPIPEIPSIITVMLGTITVLILIKYKK